MTGRRLLSADAVRSLPARAALPGRGFQGTRRLLPRGDAVLLVAVLTLCALGALLVWSATRHRLEGTGGNTAGFLLRHLFNVGIGLTLGAVTATLDHRMLRAYVPVVYVASVLGLLAVLTPLGTTKNGSHSWIDLPAGFSLQPSEFAKVALVVGMSMMLAERRETDSAPAGVDITRTLALAAVPVTLVMLQPDLGTVMVLMFLVLGVVSVAGVRGRWLAGLLGMGIAGAAIVIQLGILRTYQLERFTAFVNPEADPRGFGYQTQQARIAIGSGGFTGTGLFQGPQTAGGFVSEQQTDFVFTVAGEELGFLGGVAILALFAIILWRIARIAMRTDDIFGRLAATGVLCWFTFQVFENIGMTVGIMPVTGLPLPFLSYGGSAMFANLMAVGVVLNVQRRGHGQRDVAFAGVSAPGARRR
jgi:rod shape determining protein RodA